jgi:pimeloyl-ACP methyl ester carboxylesterase
MRPMGQLHATTSNMYPFLIHLVLVSAAAGPGAHADGVSRAVGRIESCDFSTRSLPPPFPVPKRFADGYQLFQAVGPLVPEEITVKSVILNKDVEQRISLSIRKPCLMAISGGGPAGFRLYQAGPERFSCLVSLASAPPRAIVRALNDDARILMVNGKRDSGFPINGVQSIATQLAERLPHFQLHVLDDDHFFLLSKREETFRVVKAFWAKHAACSSEEHAPK